MSKIGDRIKERRLELGYSQEELAKKLGYTSRSTINKIENGTNDIVQSKVVEFATALDTTVAYLMGWSEEDSPNMMRLSDSEHDVVVAFRKADDLTKQMVLRVLNIENNEKEEGNIA